MPAHLSYALLLAVALLVGCASTTGPNAPVSSAGPRTPDQTASQAADVALSMLGKPYRYGGDSPKGFDCSGLVSYSYARVGVRLARSTDALRGETVVIRASALRRGDLVFFDQEGKKFSHVGIYLGDGRFVHAPSSGGKVRTDALDADYWRRHFVEARRI